ncbi:15354_t:CDS:2, partial [Entrophospora sp. SA101]
GERLPRSRETLLCVSVGRNGYQEVEKRFFVFRKDNKGSLKIDMTETGKQREVHFFIGKIAIY